MCARACERVQLGVGAVMGESFLRPIFLSPEINFHDAGENMGH